MNESTRLQQTAKKLSGAMTATTIRGVGKIVRTSRRVFREHDDEVLPRELITLALALSAGAIALGLNADERSSFMLWRIAADGFALNVLSNLALVGPSLVIANVVVARWRRRRQIRTITPAFDFMYGVVEMALEWSDHVWVVLHDVDLSVAPDPISYQAPAHDGRRTRSTKSVEDQIELINARWHALRGTVDLFDISGRHQPKLQPGALPSFMYGLGASMVRDGMLRLDVALGRSTNPSELIDRITNYERLRRERSGLADLADSAGLVLESFMWILYGLKDGMPSHLKYLMEFDFDLVNADHNRKLWGDLEHLDPEPAEETS